MKCETIKTATAGILMGLFLALTSCEKNSANTGDDYFASFLSTTADGTSSIIQASMLRAFKATTDPGPDEIKLVLAMREEEKLARDVYSYFAEKWSHPVFRRISAAENTHLNAANSLLAYYASPDTVITEAGVFKDKDIQELYNGLVSKGTASIDEAFKTGALIEEMDIKALQDALKEVSNENIRMVFENLTRGSRNHLRSYNRQLKLRGLSYVPGYITQEQFNEIVNSPVEAGNRYRMNPGGKCPFGN